jgi:hypothetical protein
MGPAAKICYLCATAPLGGARDVLLNQIKAQAYERAVNHKIALASGSSKTFRPQKC